MKHVLFDEWTKALRSGNWKQGRNCLAHTNKIGPNDYCCLGVMMSVDRWSGLKKRTLGDDGLIEFRLNSNEEGMWSRPSDEYCQKIGLSPNLRDKLIDMNDIEGKTFVEIAGYLEENKEKIVDEPV